MATSLIVPAPAKLNLFLHILGRREDGYHNIQSAMQFLCYGDTLIITILEAPTIRLTMSIYPELAVEDNLAYRAAHLLQTHTGTRQGAHIDLLKKIPMGMGLGGGSSDAATALVTLNHLWQTDLSVAELCQLGATLGADIPFFIGREAAFVEGIGDILTPIQPPEEWYVVIAPPCHVDTGLVYQSPDLPRNTPAMAPKDYQPGVGHNDCEAVTCTAFPLVKSALDWLSQFGPAQMTGTGAGIFCPCQTPEQAQEILAQLPNGWHGFFAKGSNCSPLSDVLN